VSGGGLVQAAHSVHGADFAAENARPNVSPLRNQELLSREQELGCGIQIAFRSAVAMSMRAIFTAGKIDARNVAAKPMAEAVMIAFQLTLTRAT